jgi:hypothetical protein
MFIEQRQKHLDKLQLFVIACHCAEQPAFKHMLSATHNNGQEADAVQYGNFILIVHFLWNVNLCHWTSHS